MVRSYARQPKAGQYVYAIRFRWMDGGESWAAFGNGHRLPVFASSFDGDGVLIFSDSDDAHMFTHKLFHPWVSLFATIERCQLGKAEE